MVKDYITKSEKIQAIKWNGENAEEITKFREGVFCEVVEKGYTKIIEIPTSEGNMYARIGDWIVKDKNSEFIVIGQDVFREIYEEPELCENVKADPKKELKIEQEKREREQGKRKTEMIDEVLRYHFPLEGHYTVSEVCIYTEQLRNLSPGRFKDYMINFYNGRLKDKEAEREEIIKKMNNL